MRRPVQRVLFVGAALAGVAAFLATGAHADDAANPASIFDGVSGAAAVHEQIDAQGGIAPTAEPAYANFPDAFTVFNANSPAARAATYYPGATAAGVGEVVCGQVIEPNFRGTPLTSLCPTPPFPLMAFAPTSAGKPDDSATTSQRLSGTGPASLTATSATAHADSSSVAADAVDSAFDTTGSSGTAGAALAFRRQAALLLHGPVAAAAVQPRASDASLAHAASMDATSDQSFPDASHPDQMVSIATATVHGVDLLGGAIHIDAITSTGRYVTDGQHHTSHTQQVTVTGVSVAGQPASIDQNGVTVDGAGQGKAVVDALNAALQQLLAATSTHLRLLSPTTTSKPGEVPAGLSSGALDASCTSGEADGVQLYQQVDATKVPQGQLFFVSVTFASTCTDGFVNPNGGSSGTSGLGPTAPQDTSPVAGGPPQPAAPLAASPFVQTDSGPSGSAAGPLASSGPTGRASFVRGSARRHLLEGDLAGHGVARRFALLYLAFTLAFAGIVLGAVPFLSPRPPLHR